MSTDAEIQNGAAEVAANMSKIEETVQSLKEDPDSEILDLCKATFAAQTKMATGNLTPEVMQEMQGIMATACAAEFEMNVNEGKFGELKVKGDFGTVMGSVFPTWMGFVNSKYENTNFQQVGDDTVVVTQAADHHLVDAAGGVVPGTHNSLECTQTVKYADGKIVGWNTDYDHALLARSRAVAAAAAASAVAAPSPLDKWDQLYTRRAQVTKKEGQSLGISVEETTEAPSYCFLSAFKEEGAVPDTGVFRENDIILAINDEYVEGKEHGDLVNVLIGAFPSFSVTAINAEDASCLGDGMSTVTVTKGDSWGILAIADEASDIPGIEVDGVKEGIILAGGKLNKGDRIILVNGNDVSNSSMAEFAALLGANGDQATLVVRSASAVQAAAAPSPHLKATVQPAQQRKEAAAAVVATEHMVFVYRGKEDKSLGIALLGDGDHVGHHIASLVEGGPADKAGVKIGSELVQVDDTNISKLSHEQAVAVLASAGDAVKLTLSISVQAFDDVKTATFGRLNGSFGFKIIDQSDCNYVRVFEIVEGGAAATNGKMLVGDRLVGINHVDLNGVDYAGAVEVLGKTDGDVHFCFQSDPSPLALPPVEYTLAKVEGSILGLALVQRDNSGEGVKIGRVLSGGAAEAAGVEAGKDLISVNGTDVQRMDVDEITELLAASGPGSVVIEASAEIDGHLTVPGSALLADHHTRDVTLTRSPEQALGLIFGEMQNVSGHFVKDVRPGIAAGLVRPGDLIRTLNGEDITDLPHDVVLAKLKSAGAEILLQVVDCQYLAAATSFTFHRAANGGCGLQLIGNLDTDEDVVVKALPGGPAEQAGVEDGMIIMKVGDESVLHASHRQIEAMVKAGTETVHFVMAAATPRDTGRAGRSLQESVVSLLQLHTVVVTRNNESESWGIKVAGNEGSTGESVFEIVEGSPAAATAKPSFIIGDVIVDFESAHGRDVVLGLPHEVLIEKLKQATGNVLSIRLADRAQVDEVFPNPPSAVRLPDTNGGQRGLEVECNTSGHGARVTNVRPGSSAAKAGVRAGDRLLMVGGLVCSEVLFEEIEEQFGQPGAVDCWILPDDSKHHAEVEHPPPPQTHTVELVDVTLADSGGTNAGQQLLGFNVNSLPVGAHIIDTLAADGLASSCGLQNGDQIFSIGNMEVFALSHNDVLALLASGRAAHGGAFSMAVHRRVPIPFRLIEKVIARSPGQPLGIILAESTHTEPNHTRQVFVSQVTRNGDAHEAGDIQAGDLVVVVNGLDVSEVSMASITKMLMVDSEHTHIVLARSEYHAPQPFIKRTVHVKREEDESIGCHLMHAVGERTVIVAQIEEGSPAFAAGVHAGDAIFKINDVCLTGSTDLEVKEVLATCGTDFTMQVRQHEDASAVLAAKVHRTFRLQKDPETKFGFRVIHIQDADGQNIVCIANVVAGSPAAKVKSLISLGDIIYSVNGAVLVGAPMDAFNESLEAEEIEVVLQRNPSFDPSLYAEIFAMDDEAPDTEHTDLLEISTKGSFQISRGANGSFGLSICNVEGHIGSRVQDIVSGGPADGKGIEVGDIIFGVNDQPMLFADYETVVACFGESGSTIDLILADASSGIDSLKMVHIGRQEDEAFGLELQSIMNGEHVSHRVAGVAAGSAVEATNLVSVGDTLVSIDGRGAEVLSHNEIVEILGSSTEVVLVIREDHADMPAQVDLINAVIQRVKTPTTLDVGPLAAVKQVEVDQSPGVPGIRVVQVRGGREVSVGNVGGAVSVDDVVVAVNGRSVLGFPAGEVQAMISSGNVTISVLPGGTVDTVLLNEREVTISMVAGQSLGLQFSSDEKDCGARIVSIKDDSPFADAVSSSSLAAGNEIVSVSGTNVQKMLHSDIAALLVKASAAGGSFMINVRDNFTPLFGASGDPMDPAEDVHDLIAGTTREVVIERSPGEPLGLSIVNNVAPIQVMDIKTGSPADRTNMIFENDIILSVDGVPCQEGTNESVTNLFKAAGTSVQVLLQSCEGPLGVKTVTLAKGGKSLGLQLVSASDEAVGSRILAISLQSAASGNPLVAVGDNVLGVNGTNTSAMDVVAVKQLIVEAGSTVTLVLQGNASPIPKHAVLDRSNGNKLGFSISDSGDGLPGVHVVQVAEGGAAAETNLISAGDRIMMINGADATGMMQEAAIAALTAADAVSIVLVADADMADRIQSDPQAAPSKTVQLTKVGKSIGVQLVSSSGDPAGGSRIFAVEPSSAASADPEVAVGDVVLSVDSTLVSGMGVDAVKQLIAEAGSTVTLVLQGNASPMPKRAVIDRSNGNKLGFTVSDHGDGSPGIFVLKVAEGGAAAETNLVSAGDRIVMINGADATGMMHEDAIAALTMSDTVDVVLIADDDLMTHIESAEFQEHIESVELGEYIEVDGR